MKNKKRVQLTIDGMDVNVPEDYTILRAAKEVNIKIPTLCFLKDVCEIGCCRMCLVEVEGMKNWQASCVQKVAEGMVVKTHTPDILNFRKKNLELILSNHPAMCQSCNRGSTGCELKTLANTMDTEFANYAKNQEVITANQIMEIDDGISIMRDPNRCILCRRCISICHNVQTVGAIDVINRGFNTVVSTTFNRPIDESKCVNCGQCINVCPTGALQEHSNLDEIEGSVVPTLKLASAVSPMTGIVFVFVLLCGIFSTAAPILWTICRNLAREGSRNSLIIALLISLDALILGQLPFDRLVGVIYPISGYMGLLLLLCIGKYRWKRR
ncbi:MAG: 2Fe-2S iron-sulfur cluster-binding protein [Anaerovoracaceae bacterium]